LDSLAPATAPSSLCCSLHPPSVVVAAVVVVVVVVVVAVVVAAAVVAVVVVAVVVVVAAAVVVAVVAVVVVVVVVREMRHLVLHLMTDVMRGVGIQKTSCPRYSRRAIAREGLRSQIHRRIALIQHRTAGCSGPAEAARWRHKTARKN